MQMLKRIQPLILSVTFVVCCLTFQADTFLPNTANAYASWITNSADQTKAHDVYKIKPRTSETILGNNFSIFSFGITNRFNSLHFLLLSKFLSSKNKNLKGTRGCNFSFWKQDFIKVNGYNEDMTGWGKEDTELSVRLMNSGLQKLKLKCLAVCYHLHHKISSKEGLNINNSILQLVVKEKRGICINGINKYAN